MYIEAYILIGGRSSRLGRAKAFVDVGGTSLARRALETLRDSGISDKITFVAGDQTQFAIEAITLDAPFIFDLVPGRGPLGGLHAALSYAQAPWIFLLACDLPFVTCELIRLLGDMISDACSAVVPEQPDGRLQPLCAFYNVATARPIVDEIIHRPRVSPPMQEVVGLLNARIIRPEEYTAAADQNDNLFANINNELDLTNVRQTLVCRGGTAN